MRYQPHPHQQALATVDDLGSFPQTLQVPKQSIYLWLAQEIVQWKFFARHLNLVERDIERIMNDFQGMSECCYQVFMRWEQSFAGSGECSYRKLGQVLRTSEPNRHLYVEYVKRVKELEHLQ